MSTITKLSLEDRIEFAYMACAEELNLEIQREAVPGSTTGIHRVVVHHFKDIEFDLTQMGHPPFETVCGLDTTAFSLPKRLVKLVNACGDCGVTEAELAAANLIVESYRGRV